MEGMRIGTARQIQCFQTFGCGADGGMGLWIQPRVALRPGTPSERNEGCIFGAMGIDGDALSNVVFDLQGTKSLVDQSHRHAPRWGVPERLVRYKDTHVVTCVQFGDGQFARGMGSGV
jgi:hypothetical protein